MPRGTGAALPDVHAAQNNRISGRFKVL